MRSSIHTLVSAALLLTAALPARAIVGGTATSDFRHVDNGVQITDSWVLTARHVGYAQGSTYENGYGSSIVAERFNLGGGPTLVNDLALLRLATPITAAPVLSLLANQVPFGDLAAPIDVTIATGSNQVPRGYAFAQLRGAIDQIDPDNNGPEGLYPVNWLLAYNDTFSAPYVQSGDSGGGLFLGQVGDSAGSLLMGITSARLGTQATGFGSAFVQLAAYRGWIDGTMAANLSDSQMAHWVSLVPEPATWALTLAGCALLAGVSARRRSASPSP